MANAHGLRCLETLNRCGQPLQRPHHLHLLVGHCLPGQQNSPWMNARHWGLHRWDHPSRQSPQQTVTKHASGPGYGLIDEYWHGVYCYQG